MGDGALGYRASRIEEFIGERERLSAGASPDCAWITGNPDPTEWAGSVRKGPDVSQLENPLIILLQAIPQEWARMVSVISPREVVEAMEALSDDCVSYLDPDSGEIITVTEEERSLTEDESLDDVANSFGG